MEQMISENKIYNAALYCRLSKDDEQAGESVSIGTQKMILEKICKEHDFHVFDVYVDDGFSGLNFERPEFQRMLKDIEDGKINLVITKDLSRLGRDYIQTGYYTEVQHYAITGFVSRSPREVLRESFGAMLIDGDEWMDMLKIRNQLTHDYDGIIVKEHCKTIIGIYIDKFADFQKKVEELLTSIN